MIVAAGAPVADNRADMRRILLPTAPLVLALACTEAPAAPDATTRPDAAKPDATVDSAPPLPPWPHELPPARELGEARGLTPRRVIVHSHSVHSHDACDGNPYVDGGPERALPPGLPPGGVPDAARRGVPHRARGPHLQRGAAHVLEMKAGDEPIMEGGAAVGSWIRCPDGHRMMILPGAENELMPIGLRRHPALVNGSLDRAYHAYDPAGVQRFREAGALVAIAHVEQRPYAEVRALSPDLVEVYNIHANIGPNIASIASPDFDLGQALVDVLRFRNASSGLEPDLAFLSIFAENTNDLAKFARFWRASPSPAWPRATRTRTPSPPSSPTASAGTATGASSASSPTRCWSRASSPARG